MKVGDIVMSTKIRPYENAKVMLKLGLSMKRSIVMVQNYYLQVLCVTNLYLKLCSAMDRCVLKTL